MTYVSEIRPYRNTPEQGDHRVKLLKTIFSLLKETFQEWKDDKASRLAAALSYYTIFSLAPLLLVAITVVGFVMDPGEIKGELYSQVRDLVGRDGADMIRTMVDNAAASDAKGLAAVVSVVTLLLGATGVFMALKDALNAIWDVEPEPGRGIIGMIKDRALSFSLVPGIGFLLLVSLLVDALLSVLAKYANDLMLSDVWITAIRVISLGVSLAVITGLFAVIYKVLPDATIAWRDVWIGAAFTAALFTLGRFAIGLYIGNSSTASSYGAAASLIVILLWIYYAAQILFFGAEFTQVYARRFGSQIESDAADRETGPARAPQGIAPRERPRAAPERAAPRRQSPMAAATYVQKGKPLGYALTGLVAFFLGVLVNRDS